MVGRSLHKWVLISLLVPAAGCQVPSGAGFPVNGFPGQAGGSDGGSGGGTVGPVQYDEPCVSEGEPANDTLLRMYIALNDYRRACGVPTLAYSKTLEAAANFQAEDLYRRNFFAHINPDGEGPGERAIRFGYCHEYAGENIAAGNVITTPEAVQIGFQNSPDHDLNMKHEPYRLVGMGHYYSAVNGWHYWVQVMALPPF